jgi:DUF2933 family protein
MSQWLPYLLVLVCPLTMGVMMWVMRGMDHGRQPDPRVAQLESQITELRSRLREQAAAEPSGSAASSLTSERT